MTLGRSPEENASQEGLFLEAIDGESRRGSRLVPLAGRFTFDPVPVLRRYLDRSDQTSINPVNEILLAACLADGRWAQALAPFISDLALSLPGDRSQRYADDAFGRALDVLNRQDQRAAWDALKAALGPERTGTLRFADWGEARFCR